MTRIPDWLRDLVTARANEICEYCQTQERVVVELEVDHIKPTSVGGVTSEANLCLACATCNNHKADIQHARDPLTDQIVALFNPRFDIWSVHFEWSDDYIEIIGKTATGRATVEQLQMNSPRVVRSRR